MSLKETEKKLDSMTPTYPEERLVLEHDPDDPTTRAIDIVAPIGKGQRCLLVSPPKAGKTTILQKMSEAIDKNNPEVSQIALLINERPEEVTDFQRNSSAKVVAASADEDPQRHVDTAEQVFKNIKRKLVDGGDVLLLLDSITRLARAYNMVGDSSGKTLSGGLDSNAIQRPRQYFGLARNLEEGGSLTIVGTSLVETGSQMDSVIFQEFKGTGNMEVVLKSQLAQANLYPAISINQSGTRKEELLFNENEYKALTKLRRELGKMSDDQALETLLDSLSKYKTNAAFMKALATGDLSFSSPKGV